MTRHISLYFSLNFSFLLMSSATSDSGSCHCFSAFCVSRSYGDSSSSLWSLKRGSCGWQQVAAFSVLYHSLCALPGVRGKRKQSCQETAKPLRPQKYGKGVLRCCFFQGLLEMLLLVGKSSLQQKNPTSPSAYLLASQVRYHHDLGNIVCFIKCNKHDNWLTFSSCLGWGRG